MVGAVGAIVGARNARRRGGGGGYAPKPLSAADRARMEARSREAAKRRALNKILKKYDTNGSGKLERDQVIKLLTDMDSSTPPDTPPTETQINFCLKVADQQGDGSISLNELEELLPIWQTFVEQREKFEATMEKYDKSGTGKLSKEEVKAYLTDLNGGKDVTDEEVDMVMKEADVLGDGELSKIELCRATAAWYSYVEEKSCCSIL